MKMHMNLATTDLAGSVAFYSTLLGAEPVKRLDDYALFITEQPGLELALDLDVSARAAEGQHFGIVVNTVEDVEAQIRRLASRGYATDVERAETCCYAVQTKVWASDPEGRRWETYVVHEDVEGRDEPSSCGVEA